MSICVFVLVAHLSYALVLGNNDTVHTGNEGPVGGSPFDLTVKINVSAISQVRSPVLANAKEAVSGISFAKRKTRGKEEREVEQVEAYVNKGLAANGVRVPSVDVKSWKATLDTVLSAGPSRYVFDADMPKVMQSLSDKLGSVTEAQVREEAFDVNSLGRKGSAYNLVSRVQGKDPHTFIVVGAHYDTIPRSGPAPGAEDNGSGVATLLTIAKALKSMSTQPKLSIEFVLFSAEEEGLFGSKHYVLDLEKTDRKQYCKGAIIMDEVSYTPEPGSYKLIFETHVDNTPNHKIIDTLAAAGAIAAPDVTYEVNYNGFGSDHMSFLDHGVPAALVIERDNMSFAHAYGHTSHDSMDKVNPEFGARVASLVAQAVGNLAVY